MPRKRQTPPVVSPLLKALRLADRRARRGVLPSAPLLAEWQASVEDAARLGSPEAAELRLRLAAIGAKVIGQAGSGDGEVGRLWQSVFDAPRRGTLGKLAERVAGVLSAVPNQHRIGGQGQLSGSAALRSPAGLQTTLTDEPDAQSRRSQDFILARQSITSGWLDRMGLLGRYGSQVGAYSRLDMPFVLDTDLELDWLEGDPDPFEVPEVIGPARQMAERLISKGARVQVTRGHEVPATRYEPGEARDVEDLTIVGAYGPVSLGSLTVLDQAVLVEEKPGLLHLILAPGAVESAKTLPLAEFDFSGAEPDSPDRPGSTIEPDETQSGIPPRIAERVFQPSSHDPTPIDRSSNPGAPARHSPWQRESERVESPPVEGGVGPRALTQIAVDWVSGEDPWRNPEVIAETSFSLQARVGTVGRVELVRGRELPFERYAPAEARASSDLVILGPGRPVSLGGVALFDGAVVELQRPGILQVLLAPGAAKQAGERSGNLEGTERGRDYPDLVLAREETAEPATESLQRDVDVERRVPWLGDVSRRETSMIAPTSTVAESARPSAVIAPQPAYGLLGSWRADEPTLGAAGGLPLIAERESSALLPSAVAAMRVIDRQAELRRAEWARESEVLAALPVTGPAPVSPPVITQRDTLASSQALPIESPASSPGAVPPPLDLPLVLEEDHVPPDATAASTEPDVVQRTIVRQQPTAESEPAPSRASTPATASQPESQPIAETTGPLAPGELAHVTSPVESPISPAEPTGPEVVAAATTAPTSMGDSPSPSASLLEGEPETELADMVAPVPADFVASPSSPVADIPTPTLLSMPQTGPVPTDTAANEASSPAVSEPVPPELPGSHEPSVDVQASPPELVTGVTQRAVEPPSGVRETLGARPLTGETIRITVDWVSGEDPWADPARLEQARESLRNLEGQGVRVELVRGREVPAAQYNPREAQRATDFQMLTTAGPVLLGGVDLLDSAVLVAQRPGSLEVLLAPREFAPTDSDEAYRGAPEMPLAVSEVEPEADGESVMRREAAPAVATPRAAPEPEAEAAVRPEPILPAAPSSTTEVASEVSAAPVGPTSEPRLGDQSDTVSVQVPMSQTSPSEIELGVAPQSPLDVPHPGEIVTPLAATTLPSESTSAPQTPAARAALSEESVAAGSSPSEQEASWFDWSIARSARRTQVVEITLDWVPGADPWSDPELLSDARESARMLEDQGIQIVFRRGRELPVAAYEPGRSLQPIDFSIVGPSGPVLLETLALLGGANLITQRPGAIEVVLAPLTGPARSSHGARLPELVFSQETENAGEAATETPGSETEVRSRAASRLSTDLRPFEVASAPAQETMQFVVDWVAGQDPWSGLAERTAELVQRLDRQGIRLEFIAGRPVSPAEYAEAPAQPAGAFVLPTDRGAISLGDVQWLNEAVLRRQRPGLMHVLLAPNLPQSSSREVERSLPDLVFPIGEADRPDADGGSAAKVARSPDFSPSTITPIPTPSTPIGLPRHDPFAPSVAPAARLAANTGPEASGSPWARRPTAGAGATPTDPGSSLEWPVEPDETSRQDEWLDDGRPDVQVATSLTSRASRRSDRSVDLPRLLGDGGDFAAEVAQRSGDGLATGAGSNLALPLLGESESGDFPGRSAAAPTQPLWDNTSSMSVLVYDVTTVDGELDSRRQTVQRSNRSASAPPIGSALTYVHEGREAEPSREWGADRIGGYVIPSTLIFVSDGELMTAEPRQAARAAADRQPVGAGTTVQRVETDASGPASSAEAPAAPDIEKLARDVYREIKWRLVAEHERAGSRRLTRGW